MWRFIPDEEFIMSYFTIWYVNTDYTVPIQILHMHIISSRKLTNIYIRLQNGDWSVGKHWNALKLVIGGIEQT
jgi:hypothetical protein